MEELKNVLKKVLKHNYSNFKGRAGRSEFWLFAFIQYIYMMIIILLFYGLFAIGMVFFAIQSKGEGNPLMPLFFMLIMYGALFLAFLPILVPSLAVMARRLHDTNRSGWWILLSFVPIGSLFVVYFLVQQGTRGTNDYGEDPRIDEYKEYLSSISELKG